jgi:hypothetical protein
MPTILELFKSRKKEIYNKDEIRIESRGFINPPRGAALLTSSPDALTDLIGNQIGGALGGSANRPTDTIFRKPKGFTQKPISLGKTQQGLKDAVEAEKMYHVKQSPSPNSIFANIKQGASSITGVATNLAVQAVNKYGSKAALNKLKDDLKNKKPGGNSKYGELNEENKIKTFSEYYPVYSVGRKKGVSSKVKESYIQTNVKKRTATDYTWDDLNQTIMESTEADWLPGFEKDLNTSISYIKMQVLGDDSPVYFNATITGLNETATPEWNPYKFVGSPFNVYTYGGVERSLTFDFKLYFTNSAGKHALLTKLEYLTKLVYPYRELVESKYADSKDASQLMFSPNFIFLSIRSLYKDVFGIVDTLSFSIDDNVPWATSNNVKADKGTGLVSRTSEVSMIPTVINVNFGMKIIDNKNTFKITDEDNKKVFNYNFRNPDNIQAYTSKLQSVRGQQKNAAAKEESLSKINAAGKVVRTFSKADVDAFEQGYKDANGTVNELRPVTVGATLPEVNMK